MSDVKFSHISDSHLGGWRNPELNELSLKAFETAIEKSIDEEVDFVLFSGDLFDTSRPPIDTLERAVESLRDLEDSGIELYAIEGSHDFSPTDKTMLKVLESAGLLTRVSKRDPSTSEKLRLKFTEDDKTGAKITGIVGRQRTLEESYYRDLAREPLEGEEGFKIFMFHSAITEFRPEIFKHMESIPLSLLPKGFDYYAGGHVHKPDVFEEGRGEEGYGTIAFPGFTFPNDFRELETFGHGGFYTAEGGKENLEVERVPLHLAEVVSITVDAENRTPDEVERRVEEKVKGEEVEGKIVLYRVEGAMGEGQVSDIDFNSLSEKFKEEGARLVKRNTNKLTTREYEEVQVETSSRGELEERLIEEHVGEHELKDLSVEERKALTLDLMDSLDQEKMGDETNKAYDRRIEEDAEKVLDIAELMGGEG